MARITRAIDAVQGTSFWNVPLFDLALFLPAGILAVAALVESGVEYTAAARRVIAVGATLMVVIEVGHGIIDFPIQYGAILVHVVALGVGAWLAARRLYRVAERHSLAQRVRGVLVAYTILLVIWSWRPFAPRFAGYAIRAQLRRERWMSLGSLIDNFNLTSVADVALQFALFLPLGVLLAAWPVRRHTLWQGIWPAIYLAVILEMGALFVNGRTADLAHLLIHMAGAGLGWLMMRRSGYTAYDELWPGTDAPGAALTRAV